MHQSDHTSHGQFDQWASEMNLQFANNLKGSCLIKSWKRVSGYRSLQVFYNTKANSFWAVLETLKGFEFIPASKNGFDLITIPLLQCSALRNSISNFHHSFSSPSRIVEFFKKEIRYPIIKETSAGYIIQLNGSGLLGGGCTASKIEFMPELEVQPRADNVSSEEVKQVVRFLSDRYGVTVNKDDSSNDKLFIEKLAEKISRVLPTDQATAINKHLTTFIDVYEEEYMDEVVLEILGRSLEDGKPQLTEYTNNFKGDKLCIELLRKGYFSRERAKGGLEQEITERMLAKLLDELQPSINNGEKDTSQEQEFRRVFPTLKTRDRITSLLSQASSLTAKMVLQFIKDKLQLKTENQKEIVDRLCVSSSSNEILDEIINRILPQTRISDSEDSFMTQPGEVAVIQVDVKVNENKEDVFSPESQSFYLNKIRLQVLTELNLLSHDLSSLVELHNLLKSDLSRNTNSTSNNNTYSIDSALFEVRDTLMAIIKVYRENESNLQAGELKSLLSLAFVQDPKIFRAFLEVFLMDLTTDVLFDPEKARMVSLILISAIRNPNFKDYLQVDDLSKCLKILQPMIEDLSITSDNVNIQEAISSLNDILFLMGFIGAKGIKGDYLQTLTNLTQYMQTHSLEKVFNLFKGNAKDPSLEIKREYTLEALKRIESTRFEAWQQNAASIFQAGQIAMQIGRGVFLSDMSSINEALLQIKDLLIQSYIDQPKTWYDDVNELRFLEHEPIDKIIKDLFTSTRSYDRNYTFFVAEFLLKVIAQPHRKLIDKKIATQALWSLANGYDYRESKAQRVAVTSKTYKYDPDITLYVQQSLTNLAQNAELDFSVYVRKVLEGPLRIESGSVNRINLSASTVLSQKSGKEGNPGKQFYLNVLSQRKPRLYAIAQIQERCEKTFEKPAILIDFRGVNKEQDFDEAFMTKVKERVQKIPSDNADEVMQRLASLDAKIVTTTTFYGVLDGMGSERGTSNQEHGVTSAILNVITKKVEEISKTNTLDLLDTFENFLTDHTKQVMVIQGDAGTGKTLLLRLCEDRLWKRYHVLSKSDSTNQNRLPIRIVLSEVKSFNKAIDEFLVENGCDAEGIQDIKDEPAVIFFDGYDEINQYINLYNLNNLDTWADVKVVFTSRKENLTSLKEDYLYCFTPGKDKDRVLSYSIQAIDESQSENYIFAQMDDKKHMIHRLRQTLQTFNYIGAGSLPISNVLLRKIEYLKRLRQGSRHQCLFNTLKAIQGRLPEIKAIQNDVSALEIDNLEVLPLVDTAKGQISQLKNLTNKSYIESVLNILELELLPPIKEAEMNLEAAMEQLGPQEKKRKLLAKGQFQAYFREEREHFNPFHEDGDYLENTMDGIQGFGELTSLKRVAQRLDEIAKPAKDDFRRGSSMRQSLHKEESIWSFTSSRRGVRERVLRGPTTSYGRLIDSQLRKEMNDRLEELIKKREEVRDFIEFIKKNYPIIAKEHRSTLVKVESVVSNLIQNIESLDVDKAKSLQDQMHSTINEFSIYEKEINKLISNLAESGKTSYEERNIDAAKFKALYLKMEETVDRLEKLQEEARSSLPDFSDRGSRASSEEIELLLSRFEAGHKKVGDQFQDTLALINKSKDFFLMFLGKEKDIFEELIKVLYGSSRINYYVLHLYDPFNALQERVTRAQEARKELKALKLLRREGSDIVRSLQKQATLIQSFSQKKFEPVIQRLNQLSQEIKAYEKEFKSIKDDYSEESLKIKTLRTQIQDLEKFTNPKHLGPIIRKFKDIIKSPFILKMLTETLVKFPDASADKAELYRLFVSLHFEREKEKLLKTQKIPPKINILDSFYQYSKDLAVNMYTRNVVSLRAKEYGYKMDVFQSQSEDIWGKFFDDEKEIIRLARRGAQIVEEDGIVRFVHKSILEYFVARQFYDEIVDYDPDNKDDFNYYLNKRSLITNNDKSIYDFLKDIFSREGTSKNMAESLSVFEKKLVQILSSSSLCKKYENFDENHFYPNLFLLLLRSRPMILTNLIKNPTFIALVIKIFGWVLSASEVSFSFLEVVEIYCRDTAIFAHRPLVALYYDEISKQEDGPHFNEKFMTSKRNIHLKVRLTTDESGGNNCVIENQAMLGIPGNGEIWFTLEGKFFIQNSQDSIVVLRADANNRYLGVDLNSSDTRSCKGTLINTATSWSVTECKWILTMASNSKQETFMLKPLAAPSQTLYGHFKDYKECTPLFGEMCDTDLYPNSLFCFKYKCVTCGLKGPQLCGNCVKHCHKDHNVIEVDPKFVMFDCQCRQLDCCKLYNQCQGRLLKPRQLKTYKCSECPNDHNNADICLVCTKHHHGGKHSFHLTENSYRRCGCNCAVRRVNILHTW